MEKFVEFAKHDSTGNVHVRAGEVHRVEDHTHDGAELTRVHTEHGVLQVKGSAADAVKRVHAALGHGGNAGTGETKEPAQHKEPAPAHKPAAKAADKKD